MAGTSSKGSHSKKKSPKKIDRTEQNRRRVRDVLEAYLWSEFDNVRDAEQDIVKLRQNIERFYDRANVVAGYESNITDEEFKSVQRKVDDFNIEAELQKFIGRDPRRLRELRSKEHKLKEKLGNHYIDLSEVEKEYDGEFFVLPEYVERVTIRDITKHVMKPSRIDEHLKAIVKQLIPQLKKKKSSRVNGSTSKTPEKDVSFKIKQSNTPDKQESRLSSRSKQAHSKKEPIVIDLVDSDDEVSPIKNQPKKISFAMLNLMQNRKKDLVAEVERLQRTSDDLRKLRQKYRDALDKQRDSSRSRSTRLSTSNHDQFWLRNKIKEFDTLIEENDKEINESNRLVQKLASIIKNGHI